MSAQTATAPSPLNDSVNDVQDMSAFLKETQGEDFVGDMGLPDGYEIPKGNQPVMDIPEDEPEQPKQEADWDDRHSLKLGEAAFEFVATAATEFAHRQSRLPEGKYKALETSPDVPAELREKFRSMGIYANVRKHNEDNKKRIGFTPAEMKEGKELSNVLVEKYAVNPDLGPEGKMVLLLAKAGWRNFNLIREEIAESNSILRTKIDDAVAKETEKYNEIKAKQEAIAQEQLRQAQIQEEILARMLRMEENNRDMPTATPNPVSTPKARQTKPKPVAKQAPRKRAKKENLEQTPMAI